MPSEDARLLVSAAQVVAKEAGGCSSHVVAVQRLRLLCDQGKLTHAQVQSAADLVELAQDIGLPDIDALVAQATPVVRRFEHRDALNAAIKDYGQGNGIDDALHRMERIAGLGRQRMSRGSSLKGTADDIASTVRARMREPLSTGVAELDLVIDGGLERPALGSIMGSTGSGKSLFLTHLSAASLLSSYNVAYLTLELSEAQVRCRVYQNLLDVTKETLLERPHMCAERFEMLRGEGLGELRVMYATPRASTPTTLRGWLRRLESEEGFRPELIVVDYADKMAHKAEQKGKEIGPYKEMEYVYEALRDAAVEYDGWCWTASQTSRGGLHHKFVDLEHAADSMNKSRVVDLMLAIARTRDDEANGMIRFRVPKRREGVAHSDVGPLPMDAAHGRITVITRDVPWENRR
jgi:RecA/RadA recombinase